MAKELNAADKITLERMKLMTSHRFFASILLRLSIKEYPKEVCSTMGVDARGNLIYNAEFVEALSADELRGVLCHEVMHVVLRHCYRMPAKVIPEIWNYAVDLVVNDIIVNYEKFTVPVDLAKITSDNFEEIEKQRKENPNIGKSLIPREDGIYTFYIEGTSYDLLIRDRSSEAIYLDLLKILVDKDSKESSLKGGAGSAGEGYRRKSLGECLDKHILGNDSADGSSKSESPKELSEEEQTELDRKWSGALASANMEDASNSRGGAQGWVGRQLAAFARPQINWRVALHRYIREVLPYDCSYSRPSKRAYSTGVYTPIIYKKPENIVVAIDVSGSIGDEDLKKFISEIYGILKAYNNVGVRVLFWSTKVDYKNDTIYTISKIPKILDVKPFTTGGTQISCVEDYLNSTISKESAIVYITDGYVECTPSFACQSKKRLFIISSEGSEEILSNYGVTAKLKL